MTFWIFSSQKKFGIALCSVFLSLRTRIIILNPAADIVSEKELSFLLQQVKKLVLSPQKQKENILFQ